MFEFSLSYRTLAIICFVVLSSASRNTVSETRYERMVPSEFSRRVLAENTTFSLATTNSNGNATSAAISDSQSGSLHRTKKVFSFDFKRAKNLALYAVNLIHQRFEFDTRRVQFLLSASNLPTNAWDILKYKMAKKIVEGKNSSFLMIFGGSSVTAGHDNNYWEAYPFVMERHLAAAFAAVGVDLKVHNIAHGSNNCRPSNLCYEGTGGYNADWIGWEQSYNCGRDRGVFELVARIAYWNKAVAYYIASGGFAFSHCKKSKDPIPWISDKWTPESAGLTKAYHPNRTTLMNFKEKLNDWYRDGSSAARFADAILQDGYEMVAPHGFSVWTNTRSLCKQNDSSDVKGPCGPMSVMGACYDQGGPHWMTAEAFQYAVGSPAKHHPPAGMHRLRGEFLAYNMGHIFLDALYTAEKDLKTKSKQQATLAYQAELDKLQNFSLPKNHHCGSDCVTRPTCYTNFEPHFNPDNRLSNVLLPTSDLAKWKIIRAGKPGAEKLGFKDVKVNYEGQGANLTLSMTIQIKKSSPYLRICGYLHKNSLRAATFFLDPNITVHTTGAVTVTDSAAGAGGSLSGSVSGSGSVPGSVPGLGASGGGSDYKMSSNAFQVKSRKYMQDECTQLSELPVGEHVLTVMVAHPTDKVYVSHLILFE